VFTWKTGGTKIRERNLVEFFSMLKSPLGYRYVEDEDDDPEMEELDCQKIQTIIGKQEIAKTIFLMGLPVDNGYIPFGVVLHAACKNAYGKKFLVDVEKDAYTIIRQQEVNCLATVLKIHNDMNNQKVTNCHEKYFLKFVSLVLIGF
jgi:hypothetical protein